MSAPQLAAPSAVEPRPAIPSAAELAARIEIPRRLPPRHDGQPLRHLSHSSYNRFVLCPEDWRRRYILGEKTAPTGAMFLGRQVDEAITLYYRHVLDRGDQLAVDQVMDAFWDGWKAAAEAEREQHGIAWEEELREDRAVKLGLDALELTFAELIPRLGEPVAVQRAVEYTLAPELEWSVLCYLDLETVQRDGDGERPIVIDYKVKTTPLMQDKADHDFQPAVYLAGRWLEHDPASAFQFAQIAKPGARRREVSASLVSTADRPGSCAARSCGSRRLPARSSPATSGSGPTSRWGSPTRAAGSAASATARRGRAAQAGPDSDRVGWLSDRQG